MTLGLYGGSFDPPHLGHVELARAREAGAAASSVCSFSSPPTRVTSTSRRRLTIRLRLARAAFPDDDVVLDPTAAHGRPAARAPRVATTRCS